MCMEQVYLPIMVHPDTSKFSTSSPRALGFYVVECHVYICVLSTSYQMHCSEEISDIIADNRI
jgi:hypothetical protein